VASAEVKKLERDERIFALVALAARRMLDACGDPQKRGFYSLELLNLMQERGYDARRTKSLQKFVYRILRIKDENIDPKVKEAWKVRLIPIDEAIREIHVRDAKEEGLEQGLEQGLERGLEQGLERGLEQSKIEIARSMLADGLSPEAIRKYTGLDKEDILALS